MHPRLPEIDANWAKTLRETYEQLLSQHLAAIPNTPSERLIFVWNAVVNDYQQLVFILYASGEPIENLPQLFSNAARAYLEMVSLRGNNELNPAHQLKDYSTGNSYSTYLAICMAVLTREWDLALKLAPLIWDPPDAKYVGFNSVLCTNHQQVVAYALKYFLLDNKDQAKTLLNSIDRLREEIVGEFLMVKGLVFGKSDLFVKGLRLTLSSHAELAANPINYRVPNYFLCIPALGLTAYALQHGLITPEDLPASNVFFPYDLFML